MTSIHFCSGFTNVPETYGPEAAFLTYNPLKSKLKIL